MRYIRRYATALAVPISVVVDACTKPGDSSAAADSARAAADRSSAARAVPAARDTGGTKGMDGMKGMMDSAMAGMRNEARTHLMRVMSASGDGMKSILPMPRRMVANLIAKMNGEMRDMKMASNTAWTVTVDSPRKDLVRLPKRSNAELTAMMPAHTARITRLSGMHEKMMRSMSDK